MSESWMGFGGSSYDDLDPYPRPLSPKMVKELKIHDVAQKLITYQLNNPYCKVLEIVEKHNPDIYEDVRIHFIRSNISHTLTEEEQVIQDELERVQQIDQLCRWWYGRYLQLWYNRKISKESMMNRIKKTCISKNQLDHYDTIIHFFKDKWETE